jgi:hypothetical protein
MQIQGVLPKSLKALSHSTALKPIDFIELESLFILRRALAPKNLCITLEVKIPHAGTTNFGRRLSFSTA